MSPIINVHLDEKMAWKGSDLIDSDRVFELGPGQALALEELLAGFKDTPLELILKKDVQHPALVRSLEQLFQEIQHGLGFQVVRGMPISHKSVDEIEKMFWIVALHLGFPLSQNFFGRRMTRVQEQRTSDGAVSTRGTKSRHELAIHNDAGEISGLMCVRPAKSGGETQLVSVLTVHNEFLRRCPELLPVLYRGFPHHRRGEQQDDQPVITPYDVPVFCNVDGRLSGSIVYGNIAAALHELGRELTDEEQKALDTLQLIAMEVQYSHRWEAGDILWFNDLTMWHARSDYVDWDEPEQARMLLRCWLEVEREKRPVVKELHFLENKDHWRGVDPVPDRAAKVAASEYLGMKPEIAEIISAQQQRRKKLIAEGVNATE